MDEPTLGNKDEQDKEDLPHVKVDQITADGGPASSDLDLEPDLDQKALTKGRLGSHIPGSGSSGYADAAGSEGVDDLEALTEGDLKALWSRIASASLWSHWALTGQFEEVGGRPFRFMCKPRCERGSGVMADV